MVRGWLRSDANPFHHSLTHHSIPQFPQGAWQCAASHAGGGQICTNFPFLFCAQGAVCRTAAALRVRRVGPGPPPAAATAVTWPWTVERAGSRRKRERPRGVGGQLIALSESLQGRFTFCRPQLEVLFDFSTITSTSTSHY